KLIPTLDIISEKLQNVNQLFTQGLYFKALDALDDFEQKEELNHIDQVSCHILKSYIYFELGKYTDALKFAELARNISQELGNKPLLVDSFISKAFTLCYLKDFNGVLDLLSKGEDLLKQLTKMSRLDFAKRDALLKLIKSLFFFLKRHNIDKALEYGEESLKISEENGNYKEITWALHLNSSYYFANGDLNRTITYLERCLKIQRTYRKRDDWKTLKDLGVFYGIKGELDLALEYTKQSLTLAEEIGNTTFIAECLNNSALIYREKGDLDRAIEALERNLTIFEEFDNKMKLLAGLDSLFVVSLDTYSLKQAEQYLMRMQQINEQIQDNMVDVACRVNKALMLKMSSNSLDLGKAKKILKDIIKEDVVNWEFTERALLHLCEIFLKELQISNNPEILSEINAIIKRLLDFAEFQRSYRLLAETNLLQGKLALMQMNIGHARQLFAKAERIAEEHGLHLLARTISSENDKLLEQLEIWENLRESKAPLAERIELSRLNEQMERMVRKGIVKVPKLDFEQPVLLTIMSKDGKILLSNPFTADVTIDSAYFSEFLSSCNEFCDQILSESFDRMKFGQHTVLVTAVDSFSICYIFQGQSYSARQKLTHFSKAAKKKHDIIRILKEASNKNIEINVNEIASLKELIYESFLSDSQQFQMPFKAYEGDGPFVFVSYSHTDRLQVYPIIDYLNRAGINIWYDEGIPVGENWKRSIVEKLDRCSAFLVFISPHIIDSEYVQKEISFALKKEKPFFGVNLKETKLPSKIEFEIGDIQFMEKYLVPEPEFYDKLKKILDTVLIKS
ncbi:MAG: tetratricopeptide repeat protein, partial [Promethearchaeota archaeon]